MTVSRRRLLHLLAASFAAPRMGYGFDSQQRVALLDFELNDLTLDPRNQAELERTASIRGLLAQDLAGAHFAVTEVDQGAQQRADKGFGYLFDHADAAAELAREVKADWIVVGRVHKASFLFVYFIAHLVEANTGRQVAELKVEVKGPQAALTARGVHALAGQISAALAAG